MKDLSTPSQDAHVSKEFEMLHEKYLLVSHWQQTRKGVRDLTTLCQNAYIEPNFIMSKEKNLLTICNSKQECNMRDSTSNKTVYYRMGT